MIEGATVNTHAEPRNTDKMMIGLRTKNNLHQEEVAFVDYDLIKNII